MSCELLCAIAGNNFITSVINNDSDIVTVNHKLNTIGTKYEFVEFNINKILCNRKDNNMINQTIVDFKFHDFNFHKDLIRSWLLFIRYLQSTFMFKVIRACKNNNLFHIQLIVQSNRTCVDDILRAYANVRIERAKFKDKFLLEEICKIRTSNHFQMV